MQPSAAQAATTDKTYYVAFDERWRIAAVLRESDASAKETFVYHTPGNSGYGGSGYIDDVILRDRDHNSGWTSAADGTLEQRRYYCQNWRHDVVAMIKSDGKIAERDRYLSYGTPFGSPLADATFDGTVSAADTTQVNADWGANYHVRSDFNLDGAVGAADSAEVTANTGKTLGWGTLSDTTNVGNRKGYAGYEIDIAINKVYHVRYRVLHAELGTWLTRDPLGYVQGMNIYTYGSAMPTMVVDPDGTYCRIAVQCCPTGPGEMFTHCGFFVCRGPLPHNCHTLDGTGGNCLSFMYVPWPANPGNHGCTIYEHHYLPDTACDCLVSQYMLWNTFQPCFRRDHVCHNSNFGMRCLTEACNLGRVIPWSNRWNAPTGWNCSHCVEFSAWGHDCTCIKCALLCATQSFVVPCGPLQ
jgi:RHS repeat-associated protein